ncbi:hypothetical protein D3C71_1566480 [compost metagenome]
MAVALCVDLDDPVAGSFLHLRQDADAAQPDAQRQTPADAFKQGLHGKGAQRKIQTDGIQPRAHHQIARQSRLCADADQRRAIEVHHVVDAVRLVGQCIDAGAQSIGSASSGLLDKTELAECDKRPVDGGFGIVQLCSEVGKRQPRRICITERHEDLGRAHDVARRFFFNAQSTSSKGNVSACTVFDSAGRYRFKL